MRSWENKRREVGKSCCSMCEARKACRIASKTCLNNSFLIYVPIKFLKKKRF